MLELRPNCECCDRDIGPREEAMICTFECTFCPDCAEENFGWICPNCGGDLTRRPIRPAHLLSRYPPSDKRVVNVHTGCKARSETNS
ncbi:MAG TPA: DUF1272 domain-containing protein [Caulobacteraceae bacterium]|jgi:hypothetical protein|nr:DUF1272 domain-containing protein [Caulobacteraceae bacterium]